MVGRGGAGPGAGAGFSPAAFSWASGWRAWSTTDWPPKLTSIFSNGQKTLVDVQQGVEDVRVRSPIMLDNLDPKRT